MYELVSPYEAELRGKTKNPEDVLTSRFFGHIDGADKKLVLASILRELGINLPEEETRDVAIDLWPTSKTGKEPDAVVKTLNYLLIFECKLDSPLNSQQLVDYYKDYFSDKTNFYMLSITNDYSEPKEVADAIEELEKEGFEGVPSKLKWISWRNLYGSIVRLLHEKRLDGTSVVELTHLRDYMDTLELMPDIFNPDDDWSSYFNINLKVSDALERIKNAMKIDYEHCKDDSYYKKQYEGNYYYSDENEQKWGFSVGFRQIGSSAYFCVALYIHKNLEQELKDSSSSYKKAFENLHKNYEVVDWYPKYYYYYFAPGMSLLELKGKTLNEQESELIDYLKDKLQSFDNVIVDMLKSRQRMKRKLKKK